MRLDDSNDLNVSDQGNTGGGGFGGFGGGGGGGMGGFGGGGGGLGGLAIGFLPLIFSRLGCMGTAIVVGLLLFFSGGLGNLFGGGGGGGYSPAVQRSAPAQSAGASGGGTCDASPAKRLSCNVMANANGVWAQLLPGYTKPELVFYDRNGKSGCGAAQSAMGPFYCPADQGVYLDTEFYDELQRKFGAPGDFAQGYVIAHEIGHHIQHLQGIDAKVRQQQESVGRAAGNALQVKMELQADCYAGVWAANARTKSGQAVLEPGDAQEGMRAAQAIGDDTLQQEAQGRVTPESFTHGTSAQRQFWLKRGLESGDPRQCDTFAGGSGSY